MNKKELESMLVRDLKKHATSIGVKGAWDMKKAEVIEAILLSENNSGKTTKSDVDKTQIDNDKDVDSEIKSENKSEDVIYDKENKMKSYIETANIGSLVAFKLPDGKVKSAKITKKSTKNRKFMVETEYKQKYLINFDDIVWVRTGSRWPRGVYKLLKGITEDGNK